jgi:hypothetical protein
MINRSRLLALFALVATSLSLSARVISYAPYSDRAAFIAHQNRTNRHFVTVEAAPSSSQAPYYAPTYGQLVMYDSSGLDESDLPGRQHVRRVHIGGSPRD